MGPHTNLRLSISPRTIEAELRGLLRMQKLRVLLPALTAYKLVADRVQQRAIHG